MKRNPWDDCEAFVMAIRLRNKGICLPEVEQVFAEIVTAIVRMSALKLLKDPKYVGRRRLFLDPDTLSDMTLVALVALSRPIDVSRPRAVVNFIVKTVQNRLRNLVRDNSRHEARCTIQSENDLGAAIPELVGLRACSDIYGRTVPMEASGREQNLNAK